MIKKIIKFIKRNKYLLPIISLVILFMPKIIDQLYFWGLKRTVPNTFLSAGDLLSYYGALIAMSVAVLSAVITINEEREKYDEDVLNRVLQYISETRNTCEFKSSFLEGYLGEDSDSQTLENEFKEYPEDTVYLLIYPTHCEMLKSLTADQEYKCKHATEANCPESKTVTHYYSRNYINVGLGTAVALTISAYSSGENDLKPSPINVSLLPGQKLKLGIYAEVDKSADRITSCQVHIHYSNIYGVRYIQKWSKSIFREDFAEIPLSQERI